jgi:hypothetical protein
VLPDHVHRDLAKHLDNFQAQHAAINYWRNPRTEWWIFTK